MADTTILQVLTGDVTNIVVSNDDITSVIVRDSDITTIIGAPTTVNIGTSLTLSNALPLDIARTANSGVLELASRSDHAHSLANTLLDGGNY